MEKTNQQPHLPRSLLKLPMYLMLALSREGYKHATESDLKLRLPDFAVLAAIAEFGPCDQQQIGQRVGFDKSDVTKIINRLENDGLVERRDNKDDRRRHSVQTTPQGKKQLVQSEKEITSTMKDFLHGLTAAEYEQLRKLLLRALAVRDPRFRES